MLGFELRWDRPVVKGSGNRTPLGATNTRPANAESPSDCSARRRGHGTHRMAAVYPRRRRPLEPSRHTSYDRREIDGKLFLVDMMDQKDYRGGPPDGERGEVGNPVLRVDHPVDPAAIPHQPCQYEGVGRERPSQADDLTEVRSLPSGGPAGPRGQERDFGAKRAELASQLPQ